jgi:sterol desaturase/sphingolipid hydroxylase (fatty acid hydroxylase superfamily)
LSFAIYILIFELAANHPDAEKYLIRYNSKSASSRKENVLATQKKLSFLTQLYDTALVTLGPSGLLNAIVITRIGQRFHPVTDDTANFPPITEFLFQIIVMLLVSDLALYWGHRIQHMNEFLWKNCHSYHHQIDTPTAASTVSIENTDATLQAGLPVLIALLVTRPHYLTFQVCLTLRFLDNVMNHAGIDFSQIPSKSSVNGTASSPKDLSWYVGKIALNIAWFLTVITLKNFSFRAPSRHHDFHHKYSNYTQNAKNFGEYFVIWDQLFGTYSKASEVKRNL